MSDKEGLTSPGAGTFRVFALISDEVFLVLTSFSTALAVSGFLVGSCTSVCVSFCSVCCVYVFCILGGGDKCVFRIH